MSAGPLFLARMEPDRVQLPEALGATVFTDGAPGAEWGSMGGTAVRDASGWRLEGHQAGLLRPLPEKAALLHIAVDVEADGAVRLLVADLPVEDPTPEDALRLMDSARILATVPVDPRTGSAETLLKVGRGGRGRVVLVWSDTADRMRVTNFRVVGLTPSAARFSGSDVAGLPVREASLSVGGRLTLAGVSRPAVLLPGGGSAEWAVRVPAVEPVLRCWAGGLVDGPGNVVMQAEINGRPLVPVSTPYDQVIRPSWEPHVLSLDEWAGQEVTLRVHAEGDVGSLAAWGSPVIESAAGGRAAGGDVVVISLDGLRADTALKGFPRVLWDPAGGGAVSTAPFPLAGTASLLTGQSSVRHGLVDVSWRLDPERSPTLAEILSDAGWRTGAFTAGGFTADLFGFERGFEVYDARDPRTDQGPWLAWMDQRLEDPDPFFLFLQARVEAKPFNPENGQQRYEQGVRMVQVLIRNVISRLNSRGWDRCTLVVASSHGTSLGEGGLWGGGLGVGEPQIQIPLLVHLPGGASERLVPGIVTQEDVAPTVLRACGLPIPGGMQGAPLQDLLSGSAPPREFALVDLRRAAVPFQRALRGRRMKVVETWAPGRDDQVEAALYDLQADPGEEVNLAASRPRQVEALRGLLARQAENLAEQGRRTGASGPTGSPPGRVLEKIRAFGYVDN